MTHAPLTRREPCETTRHDPSETPMFAFVPLLNASGLHAFLYESLHAILYAIPKTLVHASLHAIPKTLLRVPLLNASRLYAFLYAIP